MKSLLSTVIATLLSLAMLAVTVMALTGTLNLGINTGHPPVNGLAAASEMINETPPSLPQISQTAVGKAAAGEIPGIGVVNTIGNADIAAKIGAK